MGVKSNTKPFTTKNDLFLLGETEKLITLKVQIKMEERKYPQKPDKNLYLRESKAVEESKLSHLVEVKDVQQIFTYFEDDFEEGEKILNRSNFPADLDYAIYLSDLQQKVELRRKFLHLPQQIKQLIKNDKGIYQVPYLKPLVGFKLARLMYKNELSLTSAALLELRFGTEIRTGIGGNIKQASELVTGEKYCVKSVIVTSIRLIGKDPLELFLIATGLESKAKEAVCVSNFDQTFEYSLGVEITDPNFGNPGLGCISGIHLFIDMKSAIQYMGEGFSEVSCDNVPIISQPFELGDYPNAVK